MRKNLQFRRENSDFLMKYIPEVKFTDIRWEFKNADGQTFIVKGYGASTGVRGAKELGTRPQLAVQDDLISDEDARSATVIASVEDTVYKAVNYALHPKKNMIIWSGTPFNAKDPLYKAVESGAWSVNVFPVCEKFPCEPEEFSGSWPDRFDYDYVLKQYTDAKKLGMLATFDQEMMLRIMSDEDRLINDHDIRWYKLKNVIDNRDRFNFYITTDFATSAQEASDYSVISVWAINNEGDWYWVDGVVQRQTMDKNIDDLFRLSQKYKPQGVGVEVSGQQGGFISWIQDQMMVRNIYFTLASEGNKSSPGIRPVTNKLARFNVVVPLFKMGKMYFPDEKRNSHELLECMNELELASKGGFRSKKDDFIDTISMLASMKAWKPSESGDMTKGKDDLWGLDSGEKESDAFASYIV
jgi:predicted phage terminase large subunit-like protein